MESELVFSSEFLQELVGAWGRVLMFIPDHLNLQATNTSHQTHHNQKEILQIPEESSVSRVELILHLKPDMYHIMSWLISHL